MHLHARNSKMHFFEPIEMRFPAWNENKATTVFFSFSSADHPITLLTQALLAATPLTTRLTALYALSSGSDGRASSSECIFRRVIREESDPNTVNCLIFFFLRFAKNQNQIYRRWEKREKERKRKLCHFMWRTKHIFFFCTGGASFLGISRQE